MMRPFKDIIIASTGLLDELRFALSGGLAPNEAEDESLDALMRYAMQAEIDTEGDADGVWERLSGRVCGPFGLAVEGPAGCSSPSVIATTGIAPFPMREAPDGSHQSSPVSGGSMAFGRKPEALALLR